MKSCICSDGRISGRSLAVRLHVFQRYGFINIFKAQPKKRRPLATVPPTSHRHHRPGCGTRPNPKYAATPSSRHRWCRSLAPPGNQHDMPLQRVLQRPYTVPSSRNLSAARKRATPKQKSARSTPWEPRNHFFAKKNDTPDAPVKTSSRRNFKRVK